MDKYEEAVTVAEKALKNMMGEYVWVQSSTTPEHHIMLTKDHLRELLEKARKFDQLVEAVDVDEITRNVMKVFDEYKHGDTSRPHSFYDEKKPTLVWLLEYLHANGYLRTPANLTREGE